LLLVGKKGWLADECVQIAKDLDITKNIIFAGYVIGDELVPILKNAQFLILPSLYEGFGMTILEAFATGLPVIASELPSIKEIAGDAVYFVNPLDIEGIAQAIFDFSQDASLRADLREKGFQRAKIFNWKKVALETLSVYNKIAGQIK
jgi:glycosyltransferase involved in cell wall biosynthesis